MIEDLKRKKEYIVQTLFPSLMVLQVCMSLLLYITTCCYDIK